MITGAVNLIELFKAGGGGATGSTLFISSCFTSGSSNCDKVVHEDDEIKSQEELTQTKVAISIADVKGNDEANGKDIADLKQVVTQAEPAEEQVFDMVEQMPTFPGGTTELMKYIGEHLKYPPIAAENGTQGKVICRFVIGKDGQVRDVTIARSLDPYCDKEAIRVIKSMPKWIPVSIRRISRTEINESAFCLLTIRAKPSVASFISRGKNFRL